MSLATIAGAMVLDAVVGDPKALWSRLSHPVAVMGRSLMLLEGRLNPPDARGGRIAGTVALLIYLAVWTGLAVALMLTLPGEWRMLVEIALGAVLLAGRSLIDHVSAVADALGADPDLGPARAAVAQIVGRDTSSLDGSAISRAAIESLAENLSDGYVAPVFWFLFAGLPGLVCYKAINTADSMIGHRGPRFGAFGWAAARLDDLANWIPARVTAGLIALAAGQEDRMQDSWWTAKRDAPNHLSPNAGWPEAAMAGALGLRLGGPRRYGEREVDGAWFGDGPDTADAADLRRGITLARRVWIGMILVVALLALFPLLGGFQ